MCDNFIFDSFSQENARFINRILKIAFWSALTVFSFMSSDNIK